MENRNKRVIQKRGSIYEKAVKPGMDKMLSLCGLAVLAPVYALISLTVFIDDPGPVLFTQRRVGKDGKTFLLHKFRSMKMSAPHDVPTHQLADPDQYITGVGRILRKYSLDELPQLFDIFVGNMSLIGPRPALWNQEDLVREREKYGANSVLPGLTGWAQINGRDELEIPDKARLDGEYVKRLQQGGWKALFFDVKCFAETIKAVAGSRGIVEGGTGELHKKQKGREKGPDNGETESEDYGYKKRFVIDTTAANRKRVLITGAGSYIGESFSQYARKHYGQNFVIDTMDMTAGDWRDKSFAGYDAVLHVAGIAHSDIGDADDAVKARYYSINTDLAVETAKKCKEDGVRQFLFLSSMIIYGEAAPYGKEKVIDESAIPGPANFYGDSKWQADQGVRALKDENFAVAVLRLPMVYGRNSKGNYPILAKIAGKMPLFPAVDNKRSMIHIDNLCEFLSLLILSGEGGIYFPQNREYVGTADMVREIRSIAGKRTFLVSVFHPLIVAGSRMPGKIGRLVNKAFGNCVYSQKISAYQGLDYQKADFSQSIMRTEGKKRKHVIDGHGEKTHILVISQYFYPETFRINDMTKEWVRRGYKVTVITGIPNYPRGKFFDGYDYTHGRHEVWNGVEIIRLPLIPRGNGSMGMAANYISFAVSGFLWKSMMRDIHADYVFSFEVSPMTQVLVGTWYARKYHIPHYVYVQDLWPENLEIVAGIHNPVIVNGINRMTDYIYKNADKIFTTSPSFADAIINRKVRVDRDKVHYWPQYAEEFYKILDRDSVYDMAKKDRGNPVNRIPDTDEFKIAFTGNIGKAQGLDILPKTAELLKDVNVKFVIVGDGRYQENFEKEILRRKVGDKFIIIPRQPAERIPEILAVCDGAFLSFMDTELFEKTIPAKLQSYMACGMPVLAAAKGETERIIREARCGICCPIGDSRACGEAVKKLMEGGLEEMGKNGREYCERHFGKKMLMDEIDGFFRIGRQNAET